MERGSGWPVAMAGLSVVPAPFQLPARVFNRSKDFCASVLATGLEEDCPYTKAHTLNVTIETRRRDFMIDHLLPFHTLTNEGKFWIFARASDEWFLPVHY